MKSRKIFGPMLLALGLVTTAVACNDDDDDKIVVDPAPPQTDTTTTGAGLVPETNTSIALMNKTFETNCLTRGALDLKSSTREIAFTDASSFVKKESYFLGDDCGVSPYLNYRVTGTYSEAVVDSAAARIHSIDYTVSDAFLTPTNETQVVSFNTTSFCGKTDWALDTEVSIVGLSCTGFTVKAGDVIPDVYAQEDNTIYFGESFSLLLNGSSRPTGLDRDVPYTQL
jgi:hypothetical protein